MEKSNRWFKSRFCTWRMTRIGPKTDSFLVSKVQYNLFQPQVVTLTESRQMEKNKKDERTTQNDRTPPQHLAVYTRKYLSNDIHSRQTDNRHHKSSRVTRIFSRQTAQIDVFALVCPCKLQRSVDSSLVLWLRRISRSLLCSLTSPVT